MYRSPDFDQISIYDFILPFGGHLKKDNRWVVLADSIDWKIVDEEYRRSFDKNTEIGNVAYSSRLAFGSLFIQRKSGFTDRELVEHLTENPYMQYFIGLKEFTDDRPFDPSTLVDFRKRLDNDVMERIIERSFINKAASDENDTQDNNQENDGNDGGNKNQENENENEQAKTEDVTKEENKGTLIIDATCTPADIAYPTDLELCDKARRWTEIIVDHYWKTFGSQMENEKKPRTYREKARKRFLMLNKRKKKSAAKIKKELRFQLNCIKRNIGYIDAFIAAYGDGIMYRIESLRLETIRKFYDQQLEMLKTGVHRVEDRIVSLSQPWVRPIVRGKSKAPVEFGMKISISVVNGFTFIDRMSFDAYNEGAEDEFVQVVEKYKERFGHYPVRILADKIYRSRKNLSYCKDHGIKLSGPKLGRPGKNREEEIRQELQEIGERNEVEGKFGTGKRKFGLSCIMGKLKETSGSMISMDIFILNIEYQIRHGILCAIIWIKRMIAIVEAEYNFRLGLLVSRIN